MERSERGGTILNVFLFDEPEEKIRERWVLCCDQWTLARARRNKKATKVPMMHRMLEHPGFGPQDPSQRDPLDWAPNSFPGPPGIKGMYNNNAAGGEGGKSGKLRSDQNMSHKGR